MLKRIIKQYLTFSRSERNGIIILLSIILLLAVFRLSLPILHSERQYSFEKFEKDFALFESSIRKSKCDPGPDHADPAPEPFIFDPNKAAEEELLSLGLNRFVAGNILKYRIKGGKFSHPADLKKIYGLDSVTYRRIEPFVRIENILDQAIRKVQPDCNNQPDFTPVIGSSEGEAKLKHRSSADFLIPINEADSMDLIQLNGIGPVLSGRIIRYRNLVGGFYEKDQLMEVYQLTPERFEKISNRISIDTQNIRLININQLNADSIQYHPYMSEYQFRSLAKYRELKGSFSRIEEIMENSLIPAEVYNKVRFYLTLE